MKKHLMMMAMVLAVAAPQAAQAEEYTFDVHSKFVNISFTSEMEVEDILGTSNAISGYLKVGDASSFRLEVPVASLKTGIDMRDEHLRSETWLDAKNHPDLVFEGSRIDDLGGGKYKVSGKFWARGKARELSIILKVKKIPAVKAEKIGLGKENWIRVRGEFTLELSDFGVKIPGMAAAKVNDEWTVKISLFAKEK